MPNARIDNSGEFNDVRIRGFGSPLSNKAFEQSVGLVIDGIPYGRREYFLGPLFDLERVEVLRGPQGTLFGRNTTAGLFNIIPKKPTDEYTGFVQGESDEDKRRSDLHYADPLAWFDWCKRNASHQVALLHDYGLWEFTIVVRLEQQA